MDARVTLQIVDEIESTSTRLLQLAQEGAASGTCLAAEWQRAGRGRRGRSWVSSLGGSSPSRSCGASIAAPGISADCRSRWGKRWRER